jgi:hypothetical protein
MRTPGDIVRGTNKNALRPVPPQRSNWKIHQRADTSKLSRLGEVIEVSGEGCEGCVSLRGSFRVESVLKDDIRRPLLEPRMVICEGTMDHSAFSSRMVEWDGNLGQWRARCGSRLIAVRVGGRHRAAVRAVA